MVNVAPMCARLQGELHGLKCEGPDFDEGGLATTDFLHGLRV